MFCMDEQGFSRPQRPRRGPLLGFDTSGLPLSGRSMVRQPRPEKRFSDDPLRDDRTVSRFDHRDTIRVLLKEFKIKIDVDKGDIPVTEDGPRYCNTRIAQGTTLPCVDGDLHLRHSRAVALRCQIGESSVCSPRYAARRISVEELSAELRTEIALTHPAQSIIFSACAPLPQSPLPSCSG